MLLLLSRIPVYANGLGLQSGIIVTIMVAGIATATLAGQLAVRVSMVALFLESMVILADLYLPDFGVEELNSAYINPFLFVVLLIFAFYVFRRYASYTFRVKLIISLWGSCGSFSGDRFHTVAEDGDRTSRLNTSPMLSHRISARSYLESISQVAAPVSRKRQGSQQFLYSVGEPGYRDPLALDADWRSAGEDNGLICSVIDNEIAGELRVFRDISPTC
jgi:hypothetical protein